MKWHRYRRTRSMYLDKFTCLRTPLQLKFCFIYDMKFSDVVLILASSSQIRSTEIFLLTRLYFLIYRTFWRHHKWLLMWLSHYAGYWSDHASIGWGKISGSFCLLSSNLLYIERKEKDLRVILCQAIFFTKMKLHRYRRTLSLYLYGSICLKTLLLLEVFKNHNFTSIRCLKNFYDRQSEKRWNKKNII